ncbi:MAG: hypothetical protein HDQ97_17215 [Lachnospiraceae bacterium]|nr:hypothetical protein [Lachnospiraceae bacterium]
MSEQYLKQLLDYQRFEGNSRLFTLIADTQARYGSALHDEEMEFVSAAGEIGSLPQKEEHHE